ncbi:MAG: diaminopimelate epimerase [Bryobacterales bacterium]|nr:diaminopimelate epimerase [Bryobacterales bacterium]
MRIPFTKAHGDSNDFLLTWAADARVPDLAEAARAMCDRRTGVGADGWLLVSPAANAGSACHGSIRLFNSDGSEAELSGNGTRCAAAFLVDAGLARDEVRIRTAAGIKELRLLRRQELNFLFEMNMGRPRWQPADLRSLLELSSGPREVTILDVGNPQCAVFVEDFDFDWRSAGREIEGHRHFPRRTNVSFVRVVDEHTLEARFYERGAGETMSSGTGSTGAAASAILRKLAASPVRVLTPAGSLDLRWEDEIFLTGPAAIVAGGEFYL